MNKKNEAILDKLILKELNKLSDDIQDEDLVRIEAKIAVLTRIKRLIR